MSVEQLQPGFKPGQIQKTSIGRQLVDLATDKRPTYFRRLGIYEYSRRRDQALEFDVAGRRRCPLNSYEKLGGLESFRLYAQNIFSRNQVAHGVGTRWAGCGVSALSG